MRIFRAKKFALKTDLVTVVSERERKTFLIKDWPQQKKSAKNILT
jgi:hypothetical protein